MEKEIKAIELNQTEEKQVTPCIFDNELKNTAKLEIFNQYIEEQKKNGFEIYSAMDMFKMEITDYPFLIKDIIPTSSISGIIAPSETGKSTFLSQLALSVVRNEDFLGLNCNSEHKRVLWIATEENAAQIAVRIKKQINSETDALNNLEFALNVENAVEYIEKACNVKQYDLIILDCYGDLNTQDTNSVSETRRFMNQYFKLAQKYNVAIMMVHHISKAASSSKLDKNSSIGSTGFADKIRHLIGLEPSKNEANIVELKILKSNLISQEQKKIVRKLKFNDMNFELVQNNNDSIIMAQESTTSDKDRMIRRALELKSEEMSNKAISEKLIEEGFSTGNSESSVRRVINEYELNENEEIVKKKINQNK